MSKIIEALERVGANVKPGVQRQRLGAEAPGRTESSSYNMTQKELADIYFSSSNKTKQPPAPTLIRVIDGRKTYLIPWIITVITLIICCIAIFSGKRVMVNFSVVDGNESPAALNSDTRMTQDDLSVEDADPRGTLRVPIKSLSLSDGAILNSVKEDENLILAGDASGRPAFAYLQYAPSFRAGEYLLSLEAKGKVGGEMVEVILRDKQYRTSLNQKPIRPFPLGLSKQWQRAEVEINVSEMFDANKTTLLRFSVNDEDQDNSSGSSVFIRNIKWKPKK